MSTQFPILDDLPKTDQSEIARIQAISSGQRSTGEANYLTARTAYLTNRISRFDEDGNILEFSGNTVPSNGLSGFAKGAVFIKRNAAGGTEGRYTNIGTTTSCEFVIGGSGSGSSVYITMSADGSGDYDIADYASDDLAYAAANVLINSLGGGTLHVKPGSYNHAASTTQLSNVVVEGEGDATVFNYAVNGTQYDLRNVSNCKVLNFKIDTSTQTAATNRHGIRQYGVANIEIAGMHIETHAFGIFTASLTGEITTENVWIHHCYLRGAANNDLIGGGPNANDSPDTKDVTVESCHIYQDVTMANAGTYYTAMDMVGVKQVKFINNIVKGSVLFGNERDPNQFSEISLNIVSPPIGTTDVAATIMLQDDSNTGDVSGKVKINGNTLNGGQIRVVGHSSQHISGVSITNNDVYNNPALTNGGHLSILQRGISLVYADQTKVSGNHLYGNGASAAGIIVSDSLHCQVSDNLVIGYSGGSGIGLQQTGTCTGTSWNNNHVYDCTDPVSGLSTSFAFNNVGINPQGLYAQGSITGAVTFDRANGSVITATIDGNITAITLSGNNLIRGDELTLILTQGAGGPYTIAKPSNMKMAGGAFNPTGSAGAVDSWTVVFDGTNFREKCRALNQS